MTAPAAEPEAISQEVFDGPVPEETVYVKWFLDGGRDRVIDIPLNTNFTLHGSPKIQNIEIKGRKVTLYGWAGTWPNGSPSLTVEGPTDGRKKVDPTRRIGSFRVEPRY